MISVIVPIYNIEKHVQKCLDSLTAQTMKDVEFILIDDGSTDHSGKIAEQYSSDKRFFIYHTENRGLSAARNYGIEKSRGEYLMFVDGDDWVTPDFCQLPYQTAIAYDADLVIFRSFTENRGKVRTGKQKADESSEVIDFYTAVEHGGNAAWNKLYKKELFKNIRYPEGREYEDIATTHKTEHEAKRIVYLPKQLYCHVYRKGSISHTYQEPYRRDEYISTRERYNDLISYGIPKEKHIHYMYSAAIGYLASTPPCNNTIYHEARSIVNSIKGIPRAISTNRKIALIAWKSSRTLFYLLCRISGRIQT